MRPPVACVFLFLLAGVARADDEPRPVVPGDRIRYTLLTGGTWTYAHVLDVQGGFWLVRPDGLEPDALDKSAVRRVDVFREKGPLVLGGFLVGFLPGAWFGAQLVEIACLDFEGPGSCPGLGGRLVGAAIVGGTTGGIGALLAKLIEPERWETVISDRTRVRLSLTPVAGPRGHGVGLAVGVAF